MSQLIWLFLEWDVFSQRFRSSLGPPEVQNKDVPPHYLTSHLGLQFLAFSIARVMTVDVNSATIEEDLYFIYSRRSCWWTTTAEGVQCLLDGWFVGYNSRVIQQET